MKRRHMSNLGSQKCSTRGQKSKITTTISNNSHISKFFPIIPNQLEVEADNNHQNTNSTKEKMQKNKHITISDDDGDFESPKVPKKKLIKWELTKTKVYSKKTSKTKRPITNSTIKIIEDNFKDVDVNPEHLQMGIMLSRSSYEANNQNSHSPLEETPDLNSLTGTILERFGFKSDKPVTRSNLNVPENSKKRKFKYTTPILVSRTEADRDSLITANISLILSKNTSIQNVRKSHMAGELFSKTLQELWCKGGRIFRSNSIYENEKFTVEELNLASNKPPCGCLLRKWSSIPAIFDQIELPRENTIDQDRHLKYEKFLIKQPEDGSETAEADESADVSVHFNSDDIKVNSDNSNQSTKGTVSPSPVTRSSTSKTCQSFDNILLYPSLDNEKMDMDSSHQSTTETKLSSPVRNHMHRSITPDLFTSDNELSFIGSRNNSNTLGTSFDVVNHFDDENKQVDLENQNQNHDSDSDSVILIDDKNDDESNEISSSFSKICSTTEKVLNPCFESPCSIKSTNASRGQVRYSFDSDSDVETSEPNSPTNETQKQSPVLDSSQSRNIEAELMELNSSYNTEMTSNSKALSPCFDSPQIADVRRRRVSLVKNELNDYGEIIDHYSKLEDSTTKNLAVIDLEADLNVDHQLFADGNQKMCEGVPFNNVSDQKSESFKFCANDENDPACDTSLNVTDYIYNMLNSQEKSLTTDKDGYIINTSARNSTICLEVENQTEADKNATESSIVRNHVTEVNLNPATDAFDEMGEVFSQPSQSSSFIDELNRTDFCNIPPPGSAGLSRNSTGESGFWSQGKASNDEVVIQDFDTDHDQLASTSKETSADLNFITPDKVKNSKVFKNIVIKTNNVTPMQDYDVMTTPTINRELDKYGIKPLKRTRGAALLKHIYESTHPIVNADDKHDSDEENRVVKKRKSQDLFPGSKSADGIEILGDLLLQNESIDDLIFERKQSVRIHSCKIPLQVVWHNFVSSNPQLKENILLYEPLELEILHQGLKELGYKFHIQDLLTFLDKKCITVRIKR